MTNCAHHAVPRSGVEGHLEAGNLWRNVIILVQLCSLLQLRLNIIQRGLDLYVRRPGLVKVLAQGCYAEEAQDIIVESRHLLSQPASNGIPDMTHTLPLINESDPGSRSSFVLGKELHFSSVAGPWNACA